MNQSSAINKIKKLAKKYRPYMGILLYVLFLILSYIGGDIFYGETKKQNDQIVAKKAEISQRKQRLENMTAVKKIMPDFPRRVDSLNTWIKNTSGVGSGQFLAQIEKITKDNNVRLHSVSTTPSETGVVAEMMVVGDRDLMMNFIQELENNLLIINTDKIEYTGIFVEQKVANQNPNNPEVVSVNLKVRTTK